MLRVGVTPLVTRAHDPAHATAVHGSSHPRYTGALMKSSAEKHASSPHGGGIRGADAQRQSSLFEGRFGRIFRELPAAIHDRAALIRLGLAMTADPEGIEDDPPLPKSAPESPEHIQDDEENPGIDAGYTYLGQFIDHDITFDPSSSLMQQNDPESLVDFRTPRLDLDSVYGRGPADQPYMFLGRKFRLGKPLFAFNTKTSARDLPRFHDPENPKEPARALIDFLPEFSTTVPFKPPLTFDNLHGKPIDPVREPANLAARNLLRGLSMRMPSGQSVARAMGLPVIDDAELRIGKAIVEELRDAPLLIDIDPSFADNAPLWYYVLAEAQHEWLKRATAPGGKGDLEPATLGPMGGRIVAETLIGMVWGDGHSYLQQDPNWQPIIGGRSVTMGHLLKYALTGKR
jgi:hypothetical protein